MLRSLPVPVSALALWSRRLAVFALLVLGVGVYLTRSQSVALAPALSVLAAGLCLAALAAMLGIASFVAIWRSGALGLGSAYTAFALALATLAYPAFVIVKSLTLPAIADISTDTTDAPAFSLSRQTMSKRDGFTPAAYPLRNAGVQSRAYPDIKPIVVQSNVEETFRLVLQALKPMRFVITEQVPAQRARDEATIEGVERSTVLRLPEDIVIRIRPYGQETRIDIRSASRIGSHDFGSNAERIARLTEAISDLARDQ